MRTLLCVLPVALVLLLGVEDASAVDTSTAAHTIIGLGGRCLDASVGGVLVWDCHGGDNQEWTLERDGTIQSAGRCLDIPLGHATRGARLITWDCHGGDNQRWTLSADGTIRSMNGMCMEVQRGTTRVALWECHGGENQQWSLEPR